MTATAWPPRQYDDGITAAPWMSAKPFPCRENPDMFFSEDPDEVAEAKSLCGFCPSRGACLRYALEERMTFGTWGGLSAEERRGSAPGLFICSGCGEEKKDELRRGKWCGPCAKRWRKAGRPASGPPKPKAPGERRRSTFVVAADERRAKYARLRSAGVPKLRAGHQLGLAMSTTHEYERNWQASLEATAVAA